LSKLPAREIKRGLSPRTEATLAVVQALFPVVASLATAIWAINSYLDQQKSSELARIKEFKKPFFERQLAVYSETAQLTGKLLGEPFGSPAFLENQKKFMALVYSELAMVGDGDVKMAATTFSTNLLAATANIEPYSDKLLKSGLCLSHYLRASIANNWQVSFGKNPQDEEQLLEIKACRYPTMEPPA
jgi:hypothetical protein